MPGLKQDPEAATSDLGTWSHHSTTRLCKTGEAGLEKSVAMIGDQGRSVWNMAGLLRALLYQLTWEAEKKNTEAQALPRWPALNFHKIPNGFDTLPWEKLPQESARACDGLPFSHGAGSAQATGGVGASLSR